MIASKYRSPIAAPALPTTSQNACSRRSRRPRPTEWEWAYRSAVRSSMRTAVCSAIATTSITAPPSIFSCPKDTPMNADQPIVHVIDDDEAVRDSISMLFETENIEHVVYALRHRLPERLRRRHVRLSRARRPHAEHDRSGTAGGAEQTSLHACRSSSSPATATFRWRLKRCAAARSIFCASRSAKTTCCNGSNEALKHATDVRDERNALSGSAGAFRNAVAAREGSVRTDRVGSGEQGRRHRTRHQRTHRRNSSLAGDARRWARARSHSWCA